MAAGATWPPPWIALAKERPEIESQVEIKWVTESLPNNGLVVRDDIPNDIVEQVADLLFSLHTQTQGKELLSRMELSKFEKASNDTYVPVIKFLENFSRSVRPVDF